MSRGKFASFLGHVALIATLTASVAYAAPAVAQDSPGDRRIVEKVEPTYPVLAQRNGLSGIVKLKVLIGPDGKVKSVEVLGGNPVFVDNASASVKKWKWSVSDHDTTQIVQLNFSPRT